MPRVGPLPGSGGEGLLEKSTSKILRRTHAGESFAMTNFGGGLDASAASRTRSACGQNETPDT